MCGAYSQSGRQNSGIIMLTLLANMDDFVSKWKTLNFPKSDILDHV